MRDFNEIKAEVYRRSEERIKEKRRKQKIYTTYGISLCLCVVLSITVLPKILGANNTNETADGFGNGYFTQTDSTTSKPEMSQDAMFETIGGSDAISAQLVYGSNSLTIGSRDASKLLDLFKNLKNPSEGASGVQPPEDEDLSEEAEISESFDEAPTESEPTYDDAFPDESASESMDKFSNSRIIITISDGSESVYHLSGRVLKNISNGGSWYLTEEEYSVIVETFGK